MLEHRKAAREVRIGAPQDLDSLGLRPTHTLVWKDLQRLIRQLGAGYHSLTLTLGPRGGLRGIIGQATQYIVLHSDGAWSAKKGGRYAFIARRSSPAGKIELVRQMGPVAQSELDDPIASEGYAVCQALEWLQAAVRDDGRPTAPLQVNPLRQLVGGGED